MGTFLWLVQRFSSLIILSYILFILISYFVNTSWIEPTLKKLKECLDSETCPEHAQTGFGYKGDQPCEYYRLFEGMREHGLMN